MSLSVVPFDKSDEGFDLYHANTFQVSCNEQTCMSGEGCGNSFGGTTPCSDPFGGDDTQFRPNICSQTFKVPSYLPDGQYTILWEWYGTGGFFGDRKRAQTDYITCMDFTVTGGDGLTTRVSSCFGACIHDWCV